MSKDIYHIAADYFKGRITVEDKKFLDEWLNQTPDNREMFAELERVWKLTGSLQEQIEVDVNMEWSRFLENRDNIESSSGFTKSGRKLFRSPLFKIAAITIPAILIVASLFIYNLGNSGNPEWITIHSGNDKTEQTLPDGSEVWMNRNSVLSYPKNFKGGKRRVKFEGEGFFNVVKYKGTFTIGTGTSEIKVLGTQFNVRYYAGEPYTEVSVKEGKVSLSSVAVKERNTVLLAGEKGSLNNRTNDIVKEKNSTENSYGWLTKKLIFSNTSLEQVGKDIERYFNKKVIVTENKVNTTFTGTFTDPQLDEVLHTLNLTLNYSCQIKNDTVIIKK
ncbi:MAG TPA: FecR domain-containing protein [Bacteroidales bacterium]